MRVVVVGAGISGLTSALRLAKSGHDVTVVSADPVEATTSHLAAAVWFPTSAGPVEAVTRWGASTFDTWEAEARRGTPGVSMLASLTVFRSQPGPQPWASAVREVRPARPAELPPGYSYGLRYDVPLVEMPIYLPDLLSRVRASRVVTVSRRLRSLEGLRDLTPEVVVNAAGLAAGALVGDSSTYPVRGQIVRVANPGLQMSVRDEEHPGGRAYVHPRSEDCILGGTLEEGVWDTEPDLAETAAILDRCADLVPELEGATPLETVVGLRPGRREVRLELDADLLPVPVVHNYGHGGSGITISWGCADQVAELVGEL